MSFWKTVHFLVEAIRARGQLPYDPVSIEIEGLLWDGDLVQYGIQCPWADAYTEEYVSYLQFKSMVDPEHDVLYEQAIADNVAAFPTDMTPVFALWNKHGHAMRKEQTQLRVAHQSHVWLERMPFTHLRRALDARTYTWPARSPDPFSPQSYWHRVPLTS